MEPDQPIHYIQYLELIKRMTSIAGRLNDIESVIGGTKRKWRDEVDARLKLLEMPTENIGCICGEKKVYLDCPVHGAERKE